MLYVFFLLERMRFKQQALQELNEIEELSPPLQTQFLIFRYKFN